MGGARAPRRRAQRALAEGVPDAALKRLRRALEEVEPTPEERHVFELELGRAAVRAGDPRAAEYLTAAAAATDTAIASQAVVELIAGGQFFQDDLQQGIARLREAYAELTDPELRDRLGGQIINAIVHDAELAAPARRDAAGARRSPGSRASTPTSPTTRRRATRRPPRRSSSPAGRSPTARSPAWPRSSTPRRSGPSSRCSRSTRPSCRGGDRRCRADRGAHPHPPRRHVRRVHARGVDARVRLGRPRRGRRPRGDRRSGAALPQNSVAVGARATLVRSLTLPGKLDEAERELLAFPSEDTIWGHVLAMTAHVELRSAQGRHDEAIAAYEHLHANLTRLGWRRTTQGHLSARHARNLIAAGREAEGRELAEHERAEAARRGVASHEAAALIALGDYAAAAGASRPRRSSIKAEAQLELGSSLRRAGRRTDARPPLALARDLATRIDATALANRAAEELVDRRRAAAADRAGGRRRADAERAPDRRARRPRPLQPRDRRDAVRDPQDRRVHARQRLLQARHPLPHRSSRRR